MSLPKQSISESPLTHQEARQTALAILRENITPGSSLATNADKRDWPEQAVDNATQASLCAFIEIHGILRDIVGSDNCTTGDAFKTSTQGLGVKYFTHIGRRLQIQSVLLPIKPAWHGYIESYLCGHEESPITTAEFNCQTGEVRDGRPVFRVISQPTPAYVRQLTACFLRSSIFPDDA